MNKIDYIRKAIADHPTDKFKVDNIHAAVQQYGVSIHYLRSQIIKLVRKGEIRKVERIGTGAGTYAVYSRKPVVKDKVAVQQELPLELPLEKVGEIIFTSWELLKKQVRETEAKLESTRSDLNLSRKTNRELLDKLREKDEDIRRLGNVIREKSGRTFKMSEVAQVIKNGKLINPS